MFHMPEFRHIVNCIYKIWRKARKIVLQMNWSESFLKWNRAMRTMTSIWVKLSNCLDLKLANKKILVTFLYFCWIVSKCAIMLSCTLTCYKKYIKDEEPFDIDLNTFPLKYNLNRMWIWILRLYCDPKNIT